MSWDIEKDILVSSLMLCSEQVIQAKTYKKHLQVEFRLLQNNNNNNNNDCNNNNNCHSNDKNLT